MFLVARTPGGRAVPTVRRRAREGVPRRPTVRRSYATPTSRDANVHPTALVHERAALHPSTIVGPFCIVDVTLGAGVVLNSHTSIAGRTSIGDETRVESFCALGHIPQDKKYQGESSVLEIGANCIINNRVVIHTGTRGGGGITRLGNGVVIGEGSHVAHDCILADLVTLSRGSTLAGHVVIEDNAHIGTNAGVVQRSRIGRFAAVSAESAVSGSVIPYAQVHGNKAKLTGLNTETLSRLGATARDLELLQGVIQYIFAAAEQVKAQLQPFPWPAYPTLKERARSVKKWYEQGATAKRRKRGAPWSLEASTQNLLFEILNFVLAQERRLVLP